MPDPLRSRLLSKSSRTESTRIAEILRKETVGGALLLGAAVLALVWINSPAGSSYEALRGYRIGPSALHLDLTLGTWAADGLLAVFFFVVGLELKREFVAGDLRDPARAAVPIVAALGGVLVPALIYILCTRNDPAAMRGWAIPTATDIAFALAVLAIIATHLPSGLRTFLLTLAVVDDLVAVTIIALFYTEDLRVLPLLGVLIPLGLFAVATHRGIRAWWVLVPLAGLTWVLMHASGIHATVAGVLLGFAVPVLASGGPGRPRPPLAEHFEHRIRTEVIVERSTDQPALAVAAVDPAFALAMYEIDPVAKRTVVTHAAARVHLGGEDGV